MKETNLFDEEKEMNDYRGPQRCQFASLTGQKVKTDVAVVITTKTLLRKTRIKRILVYLEK